MSNSSTDYLLKTGKQGSDILDLQNEIVKKTSINQLTKAGLKKGMVVWDIGCGSGAMTDTSRKPWALKGLCML